MLAIVKRNIRRVQSAIERVLSPSTSKAFKDAKKQGLFDPRWYREHYGSFPHDYAAFKDYLSKASFSNVNPSSRFDTEYYNRRNMDIYLKGQNPLLHYMNHGKFENRQWSTAQAKWHPTDKLIPENVVGWDKQKVAIILHIYYPDFVKKFADCLERFPCQIDVFVTAGSEQIKAKAETIFSSCKTVVKLETCLAENTGRNFGPLLVNYSKQLLDYDLICHVHSKKSLYSGREQTQWFDYLNQYLLKDKHVVKSLLRLFKERDELGIYYPTSFWMMPSWVNHWTCNKDFAKQFVAEWNIEIDSNFINYPVGGMFWARPKALFQLLDKEYNYSDFPSEPLPNDGSYLHAMERVLGLLAEKNQYKQFFYYPPLGCFTEDKTYITANYFKSPQQLKQDLSAPDIISFDIFDTILRRRYSEPDYAKLLLGKELVKRGNINTVNEFIKARNDAEFQCRRGKGFKGDVDIFEIYGELSKCYSFIQGQSDYYAELEFCFDLEQAIPKSEMVNIATSLHESGKEIWFITDIYYTQKQIELMIKRVGISFPYRLFVSSELGKRKDSGDMWRYIKGLIDESGSSHVHVGDNVRSDAQICGDLGLQNMHILHPDDKWQIAGMPEHPKLANQESEIIKWGRLKSNFGRYPFFGE